MKKALFTILLFCLASVSTRADLIFYEPFNYPDGSIETNSAGLWVCYSPASPVKDAIVRDHRLENAATSPPAPNPVNRQDDIGRPFATVPGSDLTNHQYVVYASFTVSCTNLPTAAGNYFAHFKDASSSNFVARIFALTGTPGLGSGVTNFQGLPGTWRLGIAAAGGAPNQVFPVDLAMNTDYQVVVSYDPVTLVAATMWVNPLSAGDTSVTTSDAVSGTLQQAILSAFAFRQASGAGNSFFTISNLAVATTFDEAATNVWSPAPVAPSVVTQPQNATNYSGNPATLWVVANGQGLAGLSYQWHLNGIDISNPNGNTNVLSIPSLSGSDNGEYTVVVSTTAGLSTTSAVAYVSVNTTPTPPTFVVQPQPATNYIGTMITLKAQVNGTGPMQYQWYRNGAPVSDGPGTAVGDASVTSGSQTPTLIMSNVSTNQTGTYTLQVTGGVAPAGTSTPVFVQVLSARPVSISFLRSLLNPSTWQASDTTTLYNITGTIISYTNLNAGQSSYYLQDSTAGINLFVSGTTAFRPQMGDIVTASGSLSSYNNNLELACLPNNPYHTYGIIGHTNLPAPFVFYPYLTNNTPLMETNLEGRFVMLTNVFFPSSGGNFASGNIIVTNQSGMPLIVYISAQCTNVIGQPMPRFAWSVSGPLAQYKSSSYSQTGYEVNLTRIEDVVTAPPPAVTVSAIVSGKDVVLNWTAVPYSYSYSVYSSTDVAGPYTPLSTGLTFITPEASFIDTNAAVITRFYKVASP